jgi:hypothetical protein
MRVGKKSVTDADKRAAIELWKAKISLKSIREQLQMSERSLGRILAIAKKQPDDPIQQNQSKKNAGRPTRASLDTIREMKKKLKANPRL